MDWDRPKMKPGPKPAKPTVGRPRNDEPKKRPRKRKGENEMNLSSDIKNAVHRVIREIRAYESDTFSASGAKLTFQEAEAIAVNLIRSRIDIGINVDGVSLSALLEEIR
jgi:hypothetical protein